MTLAATRKQAPDSTHKAERDGARDAPPNPQRTRGSFPVPFIQRKPTCACGGGCPRCKEHAGPPELKIGRPGDEYEQEADRIAERVVQVPDPERLEEPLILQRRAAHHAEPAMVPPIVQEVLRSPGQPLDPATRAFIEPRFGHDFSHVRVHTDARASESARAVDALAYTVGGDVVFGRGQYAPDTLTGKRLLAHELTHALQQMQPSGLGGRGSAPRREAKAELATADIAEYSQVRTVAVGPVPAASNPPDAARMIQRQPMPAPPKARKKIKKIILYKKQGVEVFVLEDDSQETIPLLDHCDPKPGHYTAQVRPRPQRPEQLNWVTDQKLGCTAYKGYIAKLATPLKLGTLKGVTSITFEVRDDQTGIATGETKAGAEAGGQGPGNEQGTAKEETQPTAQRRSAREIWREIETLPKHIQKVLIAPKYGVALKKAEDYEIVLRIGKKLESAGVSPEELFEYRKAAAATRSVAAFEVSIDRFLLERSIKQAGCERNIAERGEAEVTLFGREALYRRYRDLLSRLKREHGHSAEAETNLQTIGASPALIKMRGELDADLINAGFPGGIAGFEKFIRGYEAAFEKETLAIAFDVLLKYEHILHREAEHFEPGKTGKTSEAAKMLESLGKVRGPAQALYNQASRERHTAKAIHSLAQTDIPAMSGKSAGAERAKAEALQREATKHKKEAEEMVVGAVPEHPIVGWQNFPREKLLSRTTPEAVRHEVAWYIATHEAAIQRARALLKEKPSRVYELDNLLAVSYAAQDIEKGSIYDLIIRSRIKQIKSDKTAREILLGVLAFALAVVSLGGGTLGLLAAGAAFGIGTVQALGAIQEYDTQTTLYLAQLLKDEPSAAWAILAVIGAGLDAAAVVQAAKVVVPAAKAFHTSGGDLTELGKNLAGVEERVRVNVMKAAEQVRVAEQQLKTAAGELKAMFTSPGAKLKAVGVPGGELLGNLVAITYYYIKSRLLKSFPRFVGQLEKEGLIVWARLTPEDQMALQQAFSKAMELSDARQLPYGKPIYEKLSRRARAAFPMESVDRFAAQGKALGKSDQEIIDTLESEAKRGKLLEATGEEKILDPTEVGDVRSRPHVRTSAYDPTIGDPQRLGENLSAARRPKPGVGYQAHHIIPSNEGPEMLRKLLERHKLDINGEFNGIWLPTGRKTPNLSAEIKHEFLTGSQHYFARLRAILIKKPPLTREQVIDKLRQIASYLDQGKLPPPKL